jgi:FKBP-type peptidyl-prolyl cis-trans isomerase
MQRTISFLAFFALCQHQCIGFAPASEQLHVKQRNHDRLHISAQLHGLKNGGQTIQIKQQFAAFTTNANEAEDNNLGGNQDDNRNDNSQTISRRIFASRLLTSSPVFLMPEKATADIDVSSLKTLPIEGDASGAEFRMKQLQTTAAAAKRSGIVELDSGVRYRESNSGSVPGGRNRAIRNGVSNGFNVGAIVTVSTPEGLLIYSTRNDNDSNELSWKVGSGDFPRGAEEGMLGMRLGSVRRIEVPSRMVYASRNLGVLPEAMTEVGRERYDTVFRSGDARLVFDVRVTGINPGDGRI